MRIRVVEATGPPGDPRPGGLDPGLERELSPGLRERFRQQWFAHLRPGLHELRQAPQRLCAERARRCLVGKPAPPSPGALGIAGNVLVLCELELSSAARVGEAGRRQSDRELEQLRGGVGSAAATSTARRVVQQVSHFGVGLRGCEGTVARLLLWVLADRGEPGMKGTPLGR